MRSNAERLRLSVIHAEFVAAGGRRRNAPVNYMRQDLAVAERYGDATTTPLEATVDADHTHFDFEVEKQLAPFSAAMAPGTVSQAERL